MKCRVLFLYPQSVFPRYLSLPLSLLPGGFCCRNSTSHLSQCSQFQACNISNGWLSLIPTWASKYIIGRSAVAAQFPLDLFFHPPVLLKSIVITICLCLYYNLSLIALPCDGKHLVSSWVLDIMFLFSSLTSFSLPNRCESLLTFSLCAVFISYTHLLCYLLVQASPCPAVGSPSQGYPLVPPVYFYRFILRCSAGTNARFVFLSMSFKIQIK